MANDSFKVKNGLNIQPIAGAAPTAEGDIVYDLTTHKLEVHDGTASSPLVTEASTATIAAATTGNATTATTATNIAGGSGGSIPYQSAANTTALLANGTAGKVLTANGTTVAPSWETAAGGVSAVGAIGSTPNANAATITGTTLNLEPASATYGGIVTTGTQTIAGAKTFTGSMAVNRAADAVQLYVQGHSTQTSKIFEVYNSGFTTLASIDNTGNLYSRGSTTQLSGGTNTSAAFISQQGNPSSVGRVRLGNTDAIGWRNAANSADYTLILDSANTLQSTAPLQSINHIDSYTTTATAAGTTTLTVASNKQQFFTGTTTQTVVLPVTSTLALGWSFEITNNSTGIVTVQSSGANTILAQAPSTTAKYTCILASGTTAASWSMTGAPVAPTVQKFTSGSGTYTTPTSPRKPLYIRIKMIGAGGGGSGSGSASLGTGGAGGNSAFGDGTANGGGGGTGISGGGDGGVGVLGTGWIGTVMTGGKGGGYSTNQLSLSQLGGAMGGNNPFGGGAPSGNADIVGYSGAANTGGGGGGGGIGNVNSLFTGCGGGAGGYVDAILASPGTSYSYAVGAAGTAGTLGTSGRAGGAGGSGYIEVTEYYQ